jgi:phosphoadenosine phosphosulfate reductase
MTDAFPDYLDVDYADGEGETPADYPSIDDKLAKAVAVTETALAQYRRPAVLWTGGKDSTLVLYLVREVAAELGVDVPPVVFIDHFEHFPEVEAFRDRWVDRWTLDLVVARNADLASLGVAAGDEIRVADLSPATRRELDRVGFEGDSFVLDPDSLVGNHLLKTVALNEVLEARGFDAAFSGVRWDEQEARADETFFSPRHDTEKYPPHDRVHPILQFDERAVWDAFWNVVVPDTVPGYPAGHVPEGSGDLPDDLTVEDLPINPKYFEGFRSLGTESGSAAADDRPAWLQDVEGTTEREGRAQDKEGLMERLRDLGYM